MIASAKKSTSHAALRPFKGETMITCDPDGAPHPEACAMAGVVLPPPYAAKPAINRAITAIFRPVTLTNMSFAPSDFLALTIIKSADVRFSWPYVKHAEAEFKCRGRIQIMEFAANAKAANASDVGRRSGSNLTA